MHTGSSKGKDSFSFSAFCGSSLVSTEKIKVVLSVFQQLSIFNIKNNTEENNVNAHLVLRSFLSNSFRILCDDLTLLRVKTR